MTLYLFGAFPLLGIGTLYTKQQKEEANKLSDIIHDVFVDLETLD